MKKLKENILFLFVCAFLCAGLIGSGSVFFFKGAPVIGVICVLCCIFVAVYFVEFLVEIKHVKGEESKLFKQKKIRKRQKTSVKMTQATRHWFSARECILI